MLLKTSFSLSPPSQSKSSGSDEPIDVELPNQWLWDVVDEFIYQVNKHELLCNFCFSFQLIQFQSFVQFRGKLKSRSTDEIQQLKENSKVWNIHSMLNVLYSLVEKSNINKQVYWPLLLCTRNRSIYNMKTLCIVRFLPLSSPSPSPPLSLPLSLSPPSPLP